MYKRCLQLALLVFFFSTLSLSLLASASNLVAKTNHCDGKAFILSDFLYWEAVPEGMEYAAASRSVSKMDGKLRDIDFDWSPGYRIGLGYLFKGRQWDLLLNWTHFHNHSSASSRRQEGRSLTALWIPDDILSGETRYASARWHLQYDIVDLELGRSFDISAFSARPFIGLRAACIHQHVRFHYEDVHRIHSANLFDMVTRGKNAYDAGGLRAGAELNFYLNQHWSFYGAVSASLLYGEFDVKLSFQAPLEDLDGQKLGYSSHDNRIRSNLEGALGLQWETGYSAERYHLTLLLCYEWIEWFDQNQLLRGVTYRADGNLGLQGGTLRMVFKF